MLRHLSPRLLTVWLSGFLFKMPRLKRSSLQLMLTTTTKHGTWEWTVNCYYRLVDPLSYISNIVYIKSLYFTGIWRSLEAALHWSCWQALLPWPLQVHVLRTCGCYVLGRHWRCQDGTCHDGRDPPCRLQARYHPRRFLHWSWKVNRVLWYYFLRNIV